MTWTDPAGAVHITEPVDHLGAHEVRSTSLRDPGGLAGAALAAHQSDEADQSDEVVDADELVGGDPPPTGAMPEQHPWLVSPIEAVAGVRAEHAVAAVARELRDLRRHRRSHPIPFEDRPQRCPVVEATVRLAGSRCGYVDLHPYEEGWTVAVELAEKAVGQHGDSSDASPSDTSETALADDRPPF